MEERPFNILGLQQVALGGLRKENHLKLWKELFGLPEVGSFLSAEENVDEVILMLGKGDAAVELDIMQPIDPEKKPRVHDPALNHIGLWVDDLTAAVDYLKSRGVRFAPGGIRNGASGHAAAFIHPRSNALYPLSGEGVLIELVQFPANGIA